MVELTTPEVGEGWQAPVFTRSGLGSVFTGSFVSDPASSPASFPCFGPRSRMSLTEKLEVLGILMDKSLQKLFNVRISKFYIILILYFT